MECCFPRTCYDTGGVGPGDTSNGGSGLSMNALDVVKYGFLSGVFGVTTATSTDSSESLSGV